MGDTWIIDIRDYLKEDGSLGDLTRSAERLVEYLGSIVEAVTSGKASNTISTEIHCRRRPGHRKCIGNIIAVFNVRDFVVEWYCPICRDNGIISGWRGTKWDLS